MSSSLRIDWCDRKAARYAVMRWHYSHAMPNGKNVYLGVWEDGRFCGAVIFGRGANNRIGSPYGLAQTEICELTRVALGEHKAPTSKIVAIAIRMLRKRFPKLRMIVSYADTEQGHVGTIYQAMGWIYVGATQSYALCLHGARVHPRTFNHWYGTQKVDGVERIHSLKHKYLYPLDDEMRRRIEPLRKPYPRARSAESGTLVSSQRGRCNATRALQAESAVVVKSGVPAYPAS